ncbi:MAG: hypothetical protein ACRDLQ_08570 [Solirubrobacterales bacterium]
MERSHPFWRAPSFTVTPSGSGRGYTVEVKDQAGATLATADAEGTIRDRSGDVLLIAPLRWQDRGDRPTDAGIEVADAQGRPLGSGRVVKYGVGPRARKATMTIVDPQGGETARLEPRDKRGEQLAVAANGAELATVAVAQVKSGFMRKSRVYTVDLSGEIPDELRPLLLAASVRYDALLNAVVAASARD